MIPAFAVGRAQQLIFALHRRMASGAIPRVPVYVDSPRAVDATEIFRMYPEAFNAEVKAFVERVHDPFGFRTLHYVREVEESKRLNTDDQPMVMISASGTAEFGSLLTTGSQKYDLQFVGLSTLVRLSQFLKRYSIAAAQ